MIKIFAGLLCIFALLFDCFGENCDILILDGVIEAKSLEKYTSVTIVECRKAEFDNDTCQKLVEESPLLWRKIGGSVYHPYSGEITEEVVEKLLLEECKPSIESVLYWSNDNSRIISPMLNYFILIEANTSEKMAKTFKKTAELLEHNAHFIIAQESENLDDDVSVLVHEKNGKFIEFKGQEHELGEWMVDNQFPLITLATTSNINSIMKQRKLTAFFMVDFSSPFSQVYLRNLKLALQKKHDDIQFDKKVIKKFFFAVLDINRFPGFVDRFQLTGSDFTRPKVLVIEGKKNRFYFEEIVDELDEAGTFLSDVLNGRVRAQRESWGHKLVQQLNQQFWKRPDMMIILIAMVITVFIFIKFKLLTSFQKTTVVDPLMSADTDSNLGTDDDIKDQLDADRIDETDVTVGDEVNDILSKFTDDDEVEEEENENVAEFIAVQGWDCPCGKCSIPLGTMTCPDCKNTITVPQSRSPSPTTEEDEDDEQNGEEYRVLDSTDRPRMSYMEANLKKGDPILTQKTPEITSVGLATDITHYPSNFSPKPQEQQQKQLPIPSSDVYVAPSPSKSIMSPSSSSSSGSSDQDEDLEHDFIVSSIDSSEGDENTPASSKERTDLRWIGRSRSSLETIHSLKMRHHFD